MYIQPSCELRSPILPLVSSVSSFSISSFNFSYCLFGISVKLNLKDVVSFASKMFQIIGHTN